jgi:hypothetical protein
MSSTMKQIKPLTMELLAQRAQSPSMLIVIYRRKVVSSRSGSESREFAAQRGAAPKQIADMVTFRFLCIAHGLSLAPLILADLIPSRPLQCFAFL